MKNLNECIGQVVIEAEEKKRKLFEMFELINKYGIKNYGDKFIIFNGGDHIEVKVIEIYWDQSIIYVANADKKIITEFDLMDLREIEKGLLCQ